MRNRDLTLVTGSSGFIGHAVMIAMADYVKPFDIAGEPWQDVTHRKALWKGSGGCNAIVHLAAIPGVARCESMPMRAEKVNAQGTLTLLHNAQDQAVNKVIMASSVAADRRDSFYGWTKYVAEQWCQVARERWDMQVTVMRLANVYGPGSHCKTSVVASWMREILFREATKIPVHGGEQVRDFVYVEDVAKVIAWRVRQVEPWDDEPWHYVGSRVMTSVADLAKKVITIGRELGVAKGVCIEYQEPKTEMRAEVAGDPDLRFECKTKLDDGLRETWKYFIRRHRKAKEAGELG